MENVEFNSDGALGITVYHQNRKGSASSTDLSPQAIARTVQAALDIARYTSPDPCAGVADKELLAFDAPDLDLFHPAEVSPDEAIELAARAEQAALQADKRITNTEGGSFNSHYGVKVFGNSHGMLQGYCSTRHSLSSCVIAEENGDMERDYAYTIVADKELLAFDAPDLDLFHPAEVSPDEAIELAARAEQAALQADKRITTTEGGSFNSLYGVIVFGNSHGMLQGYCSTRHSLSSCVIAEENGDMERDYAYTIGRAMSDLQTPEWVGADCARRTLSRLSPRKLFPRMKPLNWRPAQNRQHYRRTNALPLPKAAVLTASTVS